jgi:hypothetical protein
MRVPSNLIKTGKYTTGGEFVFPRTNTPYKGYYYEFNSSYFIGKEFNANAEEIIKIKETNSLLSRAATFVYSYISGVSTQQLQTPKITSVQNIPRNQEYRLFCKQINISPETIKEIDEPTYLSLQNVPLFITTFIGTYDGVYQNVDQANTQLPGLKSFLLG